MTDDIQEIYKVLISTHWWLIFFGSVTCLFLLGIWSVLIVSLNGRNRHEESLR